MKRTGSQLLASDPARHIWVSASAGTGKTHVLTDRLLRLMLAGSPPDRILALTFTKAAAAEMQTRLTDRLRHWQQLDDSALDAELALLGMAPALRQRARALFGLALEVPGGLKVLTLHSFAQSLLASFPLEAGVAPGFSALEDRDALLLKRRAFIEAIRDGDDIFLADLADLAIRKGESAVGKLLDVLISHRTALMEFHSLDGIEPAVRRMLGVAADADVADLCRAAFAGGGTIEALCRQFASAMADWGTATGVKAAARANHWLQQDIAGRVDARGVLASLVWTDKGTVQKWNGRPEKSPPLADAMAGLEQQVGILLQAETAITAAVFASRALRVGHAVVSRYVRLKRAANSVDFDDMIRLAANLLGQPGMPGYVAWKLDNRFDHVLVDEAQDTNDLQWRIVRQLVADYFTAADQADGRLRTLFVVGDLKQAIYGFQGTDPRIFASERARISPHMPDSIAAVPLDLSFRSGPAILEVVNAFLGDDQWRALGLVEAPGPHVPHRRDAAGEVVLWPLLTLADDEDSDGETAGEDEAGDGGTTEDADRLMAARLAARIAGWLRAGGPDRLWLPARQRYAQADDILILLQRRSYLMGALVAALHKEGVPVAGVDRLLLSEPYAVLDLVALLRFATQPEDDLNLATILVSPFLGWTHEDVRAISQHRRQSLWEELGAQASAPAAEARRWLAEVLRLADREGPAVFLDTILSGPLDGRQRLLDRLGAEANDPIDELLQQAHRFELHNPPALAGFLAWIEGEGLIVKRDAESGGDVVRLMTVHGSKGLQAPVVILADSGGNRIGANLGYVPVKPLGGTHELPIFHNGKKRLPDSLKQLLQEMEQQDAEEDQRLLYVAMTRAADHLYIGGAVGNRRAQQIGTDKDRSWHSRIRQVFEKLADSEMLTSDWGTEWRLRRGVWEEAAVLPATVASHPAQHPTYMVNLSVAPAPAAGTRPLTPSALPDEPPASPAAAAAARRGIWMHRLFERLPAIAAPERAAVAANWLQAQGADTGEAADIIGQLLAVFQHPELGELFTTQALAEAPVAGIVNGHPIAGTVDRLLITPQRLLVVDFKTGSHVPDNADGISLPYRRQMALYVRVLEQVFPGRRIDAGLLYTAGPRFFLLDSSLLPAIETLA